jgi:tetratricopeptide (TPR) repeat protein
MRRAAAVALTAVTIIAFPATVFAQQSDERRRCFASEGVTPEQKLAACTAVIESGGQTPQALVAVFNSRGNIHLGNRSYDRAIDDYDEAIRLDPKYATGFSNRGLAYDRKGQIDRAIDDYDEAIRLDPKYANAFNNRGFAYQRKGQIDRAIEDYDEAIRLNPSFALAFANRANVRRIKGQIDLAIEDGDRAIALNRSFAGAFFARADAYRDKAQWDFDAYLADGTYEDRAIADYGEGIRLSPNNATAFRNRGFLNMRRQRYDRAIQDFDEAIRLDPNVAAAFSGRAYALRFVGQYERAIADYRKALTLQLDDASRRQIEKTLKQLGAAPARDVTPAAVSRR